MVLEVLSGFFQKYPFCSNVLFSLILVALEKGIEREFECPCTQLFAVLFFCCYLLLPIVVSFVFGLYLLSCKPKCSQKNNCSILSCLVPPIVWVAVFFIDGRYWACFHIVRDLKVNNRVTDSEKLKWLWCNTTQLLTKDEVNKRDMFYKYKLCGFGLLFVISIVALCYKCCQDACNRCCQCLDFHNEVPCCSAHGQTCGSSHCKDCCNKHRRTCCTYHSEKCLLHSLATQTAPSSEAQTIPPPTCPGLNHQTCPCLCHHTCDCECHKP